MVAESKLAKSQNQPDDGRMAVGASKSSHAADFDENVPERTFSLEDVAKHNKEDDLWVVIDGVVYDLTKFVEIHPGGRAVLIAPDVAGRDATDVFFGLHRQEVLHNDRYAKMRIGRIAGAKQLIQKPKAGALSQVPYAEPMWLSKGMKPSPYFNESHYALQRFMRKFADEMVFPDAQLKEVSGKPADPKIFEYMGREDLNIMACRFGPGKHLEGRTLFGGIVKPDHFDGVHDMIITQELSRLKARGYGDGFGSGSVIGLPPILNYCQVPELKKKIVDGVFSGKMHVSLAITEAFVGSDVQGIRTTATLTPDGKHFIISGAKKWITGGMFASYFSVACRTSKDKLTMILVPRQEGVATRPIKVAYSSAAGTSYVTFDNVKVPVENVLGGVGNGVKVVLENFNHERWVMCASSVSSSRAAVEECVKWACQRRVFGSTLISQPVIRHRLGTMISKVEAAQAYLEAVTFQMAKMSHREINEHLAGQIAFLKAFCTRCADEISSDAVATFGGRGLTQTGMGRHIENFRRTQKFDSVLGGEESVLLDLGVRQALKKMPKDARL